MTCALPMLSRNSNSQALQLFLGPGAGALRTSLKGTAFEIEAALREKASVGGAARAIDLRYRKKRARRVISWRGTRSFAVRMNARRSARKSGSDSRTVDRAGLQRAPWRLFKAGPHVAIGLRADFAMEFLDAPHHHAQPRAWTAVSMMLAQMQDQVAARHLAIERRPLLDLREPGNWGSLLAPQRSSEESPDIFCVKCGKSAV
jgi:hypothetical protein